MRPRTRLVTFVGALFAIIGFAQCQGPRTDNEFWSSLVSRELEEALRVKWNLGTARNVVLFIGDGMGPATVAATRLYRGGESHRLFYETFPHVGMLKTYNANYMVPDSASTATALFCGVKTNQNTVGVDATVTEGDCASGLRPESRLRSLAVLAQQAGKSTGLVTSMRVTHATPAPLYAHSADRRWECEAVMPAAAVAAGCKDIARQLVEDEPGASLNVIMGGGRQVLVSNSSGSPSDPLDTWGCRRQDGADLIQEYRRRKEERGLRYRVVSNNEELESVNFNNTDYLLGIFANGHLQYEHEKDPGPAGMPTLAAMVDAAIRVLRKNEKGFFLMVEGGNIDMAHHRGKAKKAIDESAAMEQAVQVASALVDEEDTLLIVTSDHSHGLQINGFPKRGSSVFGIVKNPNPAYGPDYTTLTYGTGGPGAIQYSVKVDDNNKTSVERRDPNLDDTEDFEYEQIAAAAAIEAYHGGDDVAIYARGPYSHLFHNVHEQHYVYHVISYAARLGQYASSQETVRASCVLTAAILFATALLAR
ncbi:unnamed protein product [Plutella xylostella]|uniref:Alkaline phosphatase n=1 Tax=Plutella xylostella TaxID=51655 RepID=A0A8S4F313_PLUXY|nr:unnamed protein product [Plutella xylostella]